MAVVKNVDDFWPIIQAIENSDARTAAIMMGAFIDNWLGLAILKRLVPLGKDKREILFGVVGPLNTFNQKIEMAYGLGLIGPLGRSDLLLIKNVRNHFAHEMEPTDFTHPDVIKDCMNLWYPTKWAKDENEPEETDPKERYFLSGHHYAAGLDLLCGAPMTPPVIMGFLPE